MIEKAIPTLIMKKRLWIGLSLVLAVIAIAVLAMPESRLIIVGYLQRENRFEGLPRSYWRFKVNRYVSQHTDYPVAMRSIYWGKLLQLFARTGEPEKPKILAGDPKAVPVLIDLIKEKSTLRSAWEVYRAIANIGPSARDALPILEEDLHGEEPFFCVAAVQTMPRLGSESVPYLNRALKHDDSQVRGYAAYSLGEMGQTAKNSVPSLIERLQDEDESVRYWSAIALANIDPEKAKKAGAEKFMPLASDVATSKPR